MTGVGSGVSGASTQTYKPEDRIPPGAVLTVGNFDGLHRAHQQIIALLREMAGRYPHFQDGGQCVAGGIPGNGGSVPCFSPCGLVTFEPSPLVVLHQEFPFILTPWTEKEPRLAALGLDFVYRLAFDDVLRRTPARVFLEKMILEPLQPRAIVVGPDHRFGSGRAGDAELLSLLARRYNFELRIVPEFRIDGLPVKSTRIRERLLLGAVRAAAELLGYRYQLIGTVVRGQGIGTKLGFPTINLKLLAPDKLVPAPGVYAVYCSWNAETWPGAMNIGFRPTFDGTVQSLEIHLLDDPGERTPHPAFRIPHSPAVTVALVEYLRPERKFASPLELKNQIAADVATCRLILAENPPE